MDVLRLVDCNSDISVHIAMFLMPSRWSRAGGRLDKEFEPRKAGSFLVRSCFNIEGLSGSLASFFSRPCKADNGDCTAPQKVLSIQPKARHCMQ
jgi:hypothetical protein